MLSAMPSSGKSADTSNVKEVMGNIIYYNFTRNESKVTVKLNRKEADRRQKKKEKEKEKEDEKKEETMEEKK